MSIKYNYQIHFQEGFDDESKFIEMTILFLIIKLLIIISAILIALEKNRTYRLLYMIIAFLFPEIYIFQHAVKAYFFKQNSRYF